MKEKPPFSFFGGYQEHKKTAPVHGAASCDWLQHDKHGRILSVSRTALKIHRGYDSITGFGRQV
jgi:hypothetical protein